MATAKKPPAAEPPRGSDLKARIERLMETLPEVVPDKPEVPILDSKGKPYTQGLPLPKPYALTRCADEVESKEVSWLWPGRVLGSRITMLMGMPGQGKSTLASWVASLVTTGGTWPDCGTDADRGTVLLAQAEESEAEDLAPRLVRFGADLSKLHYLDEVRDGARERPFSLGRDCNPGGPLEAQLDRHGDVRLLIVDPMGAFMWGTDTSSTEAVYEALRPLKRLTERRGFAAMLLAHPNKSGEQDIVHRIAGSQAFSAIARAFWMVSEDPNDPTRRMLSYAKGNPEGINRKPLAWAKDGDGMLVFDPECGEMCAKHVEFLLMRNLKEESLRARRRGRPPGAGEESVPLILAALAAGPKLRATLVEEVVTEKISESSFNRGLNALEAKGKIFRRPLAISRRCVMIGLAEHFDQGEPTLPFGDETPAPPPGTPRELRRNQKVATNGSAH